MKKTCINDLIKTAKKNLQKDGSLAPMIFVQTKERLEAFSIASGFENPENKHAILTRLGKLYKNGGPSKKATEVKEIYLLAESWVYSYPKDVDPATIGAPSQDPNWS
jgi:hypothetical protein